MLFYYMTWITWCLLQYFIFLLFFILILFSINFLLFTLTFSLEKWLFSLSLHFLFFLATLLYIDESL